MRAWVMGMSLVLLARLVWADGASNDRSGMEGERWLVTASEASGIEGQVTIRPMRPVERKGVPNAQPYQARITVLDPAGREVAVVDSDAEGKFRIALAPGTYVVRPATAGFYPRASEQRVEVGRNRMTQVDIVYDSGIR
jgi:hypothetical protein